MPCYHDTVDTWEEETDPEVVTEIDDLIDFPDDDDAPSPSLGGLDPYTFGDGGGI